jgi:hypothetical protein
MKAEMQTFILLLVNHQLSADQSKKSVLLAKVYLSPYPNSSIPYSRGEDYISVNTRRTE